MNIDLKAMSLEELLELQSRLTTTVRNKIAGLTEPEDTVPEVIRVGMRRYRASVASVAPRAKKPTFLAEHQRCLLGISLGSPNAEGAKLEGCLRWIADNFDECAIVVADGVYPRTLQVTQELAADEARAQALQAGQAFLARNERVVTTYRAQCQFDWYLVSQLMETPRFHRYRAEFHQLYQHNDAYRALVDQFANKYLGPILKRQAPISEQASAHKHELVRDYLVEECAAMTVLGEDGWDVHVYPGAIKTFESICEGDIPEVPDALKNMVFVALRLTRGGLYFAENAEDALSTSMGDDEQVVGQGVLADLDEHDWRRFMKYTTRQHCLAGDVLMRTGDRERNLYMLLSGTLEVLLGDWERDKKLRQVATRGPGSVLGEQSFIDGQPRSATVAALGDCEVLVLSPKQLKKMQQKDPALAAALLHDISRVLSLRHR